LGGGGMGKGGHICGRVDGRGRQRGFFRGKKKLYREGGNNGRIPGTTRGGLARGFKTGARGGGPLAIPVGKEKGGGGLFFSRGGNAKRGSGGALHRGGGGGGFCWVGHPAAKKKPCVSNLPTRGGGVGAFRGGASTGGGGQKRLRFPRRGGF